MFNHKSLIFSLVAFSSIFQACKKDEKDPAPTNPGEVITTVKLFLRNVADTTETASATWKDPDGGNASNATVDSLFLSPNKTYEGTVLFLDETKNPAEDITEEILEEDDEHLVVYKPLGFTENQLKFTIKDRDKNNLPVGLIYQLKTEVTGKGKLDVLLKHQPGVKNGTEAPGETDAEVSFPVRIR